MRGYYFEILAGVVASTIIAVMVAVGGVAAAHLTDDVQALERGIAPGADPPSGCQSRVGTMMCEHESS